MDQKLISIVIPTYNCGQKFAASMESVLSQSKGLYEIVVVDGGSTDDTVNVIKGYGDKLRFISEPDYSVYDGLNKGIGMASGKYLLFLGAGDRLKEGVLDHVAEKLPLDGPSFVYGDAYLVRHGIRVCGEFCLKEFMARNICQQSIFYERSIFQMLGRFDLKYLIYADWAFNMKCFADKRIRKVYLDLVVADFEGWGISDRQQDKVFLQDLPRLIRKHVGWEMYIRRGIYLRRAAVKSFARRVAGSIRVTAKKRSSQFRRVKS